jgi:hypothetical protein
MRKAITLTLCAAFITVALGGCWVQKHTIGNGGTGQTTVSQKQWFLLFGLVPLNNPNGGTMAAGATDYTITTEMSIVDWLISIVTSYVTIQPRTVMVTK